MSLPNLLKKTRLYFWNQDFDEVEVPYLNTSLPLEPNIYSFSTIWSQSNAKFYLPTSPEFALKQHLSSAITNCFSIAHCFRDLESEGLFHTKEFLMLEWYLVNKTLPGLIDSVKTYISQFLQVDFENYVLPKNLPHNEPDFNQYFLNEIEPKLPKNKAVFITGYPSFLSPLAAIKTGESNNFSARSRCVKNTRVSTAKIDLTNQVKIANRFELYINGIEIANGCVENRDPSSIKSAFDSEQNYRLKNNLPAHPYSQEFIDICASLPPCAGVGLGLDRLNILVNNKSSL